MADGDNFRDDVRHVLQQIVEQGRDIDITQLDALLPGGEITATEIEAILSFLRLNGISVLEDGDD